MTSERFKNTPELELTDRMKRKMQNHHAERELIKEAFKFDQIG